jgi:ABC-type glycerol-3-phosphate transport system substrate-binding protein
MKFFLAIATLAAAALLAGCAGGSGPSQSGSSGITMYGTIDEGVTFHK